jgi:DNA-binding transcriptional MerR regulator
MASHHPIRKTVAASPSVIPDKLYFRIGDVARLCEVPAYVLRFWETEFPNLKPNKGGTGQRLYRKRDVETALRIKHLLYDLGYTIPGARQVFKTDAKPSADLAPVAAHVEATAAVHVETPIAQAAPELSDTISTARPNNASLLALRDELRALHTQLSAPITGSAIADTPAPKPLRPRLVLEPKPKPELKLGPVALGQPSLFPSE